MSRRELVTLPEHAVDRDASTLRPPPAAAALDAVVHDEWIELLRVFRDLSAADRARVLAFAEALRATEGVL